MEEYQSDVFVNRDDAIPTIVFDGTSTPRTPAREDEASDTESLASSTAPRRGGLRGKLASLKDKASLQDRLVEKLLQQVVPLEQEEVSLTEESESKDGRKNTGLPAKSQRPEFSISVMSNNFRRFNARIGVVFVFQARMLRLLAWKRPTHTLSFLAIYTFVCLDPYLLPIIPLALLLTNVLIPNFVTRHPAAPNDADASATLSAGYSPRGPPIAPAPTVKPVKELSKDFFRNMRDLQNSMEDFSQVHDKIIALMVPRTNFSDEAMSSSIFVFLVVGCLFLSVASNIMPWRVIFLVGGWALVFMGHPAVQKHMVATHQTHIAPSEQKAKGQLRSFIDSDIILDSAPETREVEIFELQRLSSAGEWEPWLFSASPYDPLSQARIAGERPAGTRFFEDVLPPGAWEWSEKKWALDLWSREWVEERIITGVEVETEGERWVYDILDEREIGTQSLKEEDENYGSEKEESRPNPPPQRPSWEEGEDGVGLRGEWRRRRWVRLVKRKNVSTEQI